MNEQTVQQPDEVDLNNPNLEMSDLRFIYYGRKKGAASHEGITCIGYSMIPGNEGNQAIIGCSFCSPLDRFSRKDARMRILGRVNKGKNVVVDLGDNAPTYERMVNLTKAVLADAMPEGEYQNIGEYVDATGHNDVPTACGVKLPWWFKGL